MGDVTGTTVAFTSVSCSGFDNGGALTTDAGGNVICSDDNSAGAGSGDITDVNEGFAIDVTNSTGPAPSVAFDPTELTGSRTWGDASTDTIVWTWNRATGIDPTLTLGSATVTGQAVAFTSHVCSGLGDGGKLTTDANGNVYCAADVTGAGTSANSFETIDVPAGTDPVADSSTDTLTITETSFLTLTGTAATDTIDITQVTTDLGTDGLIAANAVALGTDTTGNYIATIADAGNANITVANSGSETAAVTLDVVDVTCTDCLGTTEIADSYVLNTTDSMSGALTVGGLLTANANVTIGNGATTAGVLTLLEDTDAGSNFASFQATALAANTVYTLPTDDGAASEVLSTDGAGVLDWVAAGAGDITDIYNCASGDCSNIVLADGDLLNMSSVSVSVTTEGLILPQHATDCSTAGTAEGQICWEADANALYVGNGETVTAIGGGSGDDLDWERAWPASAMEPLEAAESIPPLTKTTGTNVDEFSISFDATTDEGRKVTFVVPNDVAAGTVTMSFYWWSVGQTTGTVEWDVRSTSTGADGETWDASLTTDTASCTVAGTVKLFDVCQVTETVANLGWAAGDRIVLELVRDANHASGDTMTGDAELSMFHIRIPVT